MQGMFVAENIVRAINGRPLRTYTTGIMENSIELTLGLVRIMPLRELKRRQLTTAFLEQGKNATYLSDGRTGMCFSRKVMDLDMHAAQSWKMLDMKPFHDPDDMENKSIPA